QLGTEQRKGLASQKEDNVFYPIVFRTQNDLPYLFRHTAHINKFNESPLIKSVNQDPLSTIQYRGSFQNINRFRTSDVVFFHPPTLYFILLYFILLYFVQRKAGEPYDRTTTETMDQRFCHRRLCRFFCVLRLSHPDGDDCAVCHRNVSRHHQ